MKRKCLTEKVLTIIAASIKETASFLYPYKGIGKDFKKYQGSLSKAFYNLRIHGFLEEVEIKGEKYLKMTPKGRLRLIKKKLFRQWDGLWRIISFDIEEKRKKTRDVFRSKLIELGCLPIQKSVWVTPRDITTQLEELIDLLDLKENVDYFISKALTNENKLMAMFKLSLESTIARNRDNFNL